MHSSHYAWRNYAKRSMLHYPTLQTKSVGLFFKEMVVQWHWLWLYSLIFISCMFQITRLTNSVSYNPFSPPMKQQQRMDSWPHSHWSVARSLFSACRSSLTNLQKPYFHTDVPAGAEPVGRCFDQISRMHGGKKSFDWWERGKHQNVKLWRSGWRFKGIPHFTIDTLKDWKCFPVFRIY